MEPQICEKCLDKTQETIPYLDCIDSILDDVRAIVKASVDRGLVAKDSMTQVKLATEYALKVMDYKPDGWTK